MTLEQVIERLRALEGRYFGSDYVAQRDAENEAEAKTEAEKNAPVVATSGDNA